MPIIKSNDEENPLGRPITVGEEAWIIGLISLGSLIGVLISSQLSLKVGKKNALTISALPIVVSYVFCAFGNNVNYYLVARILAGISSGSGSMLIPLYVGEITNKLSRGTYGCFFGLFLKLGTVSSLIIGPFCSVKSLSLIMVIPAIIFLIIFPTVFPETPYHLISLRKRKQGELILRKFRNGYTSDDINKEIIEINDYLENEHPRENIMKTLLHNKASRRSLVIACGISCFIYLCGITAIVSYVQTILEASEIPLGSDISSSMAGVIQLCIAVGASLFIDKYGRRLLLIISGTLMMIGLIVLGIFFYLKNINFDTEAFSWVPLFMLILYFAGFSIGFGPVGFLMLGELFDKDAKIPVASVATASGTIASFVVTFSFPYVTEGLGLHNSFWLLALLALLSVIFVILFVPETSRKSFMEIQQNLSENIVQISCPLKRTIMN